MAGAGIPEDQISRVVINPQTQEPLHPQTLRKHFRRELDQGHVKADAKVAEGLYKNATTPTDNYPGGIPVAQIFWLKTRARWRTTDKAEPPALPQTPEDMDEQDTLRRLSFLLSKGAAEAERAANPHTPHRGRKKLKITA